MNSRDRAILLILFAGFVTLVFEVRYEHRYVLRDPQTWQSWIPLVYTALASVGCLVGMIGKKAARTVSATIFFLGIAVGMFGLYMHTKFEQTTFLKFLRPDAKIYTAQKDSNGNPIEAQVVRPVAAPMSLSGLAAIGFVVTSGMFKQGRKG